MRARHSNYQVSKATSRGAILPLVAAFGAILLMLLGGLANFLKIQQRSGIEEALREQAFEAAEAGIEYYRWRLAHAPTDYLSTTNIEQDIKDPEGAPIAHFTLNVTPPDACGSIVSVNSTGWHLERPQVKRTLKVQLGKESLAKYSFLLNSNVTFGSSSTTLGPIHANGGIQMNGTHNTLVTSAVTTYLCGAPEGCNPTSTKPGVWGSGPGGGQGLWQFPVPAVDFNALTLDLSNLKTLAQGAGTYFGPSGNFGYQVTLKQNETYDVRRVTQLFSNVVGWDGTQNISHSDRIKQTQLVGTYALSEQSCDASHVLFFEDSKVWVDGITRAKVSVVAAVFPDTPQTNASIIINGDIKHPNPKDSQIALITQKDVRIPLYSNNNLEIDAIMVAQKGTFTRWYYASTYAPNHLRSSLTILGTIVGNTPSGVAWGNPVVSGYQNRSYSFNADLIYDPPPFLPNLSESKVVNWNEVQ